ncbi:hypothetical protein D3C73_1451570 [compost metagenome]
MAGRVRAVFRQFILLGGVTGRDAVEGKRTDAHVLFFGRAGRQITGIFDHIGQ